MFVISRGFGCYMGWAELSGRVYDASKYVPILCDDDIQRIAPEFAGRSRCTSVVLLSVLNLGALLCRSKTREDYRNPTLAFEWSDSVLRLPGNLCGIFKRSDIGRLTLGNRGAAMILCVSKN